MSADTDEAAPWRDAETLRRLYVTERLSVAEVGERLGCAKPTVARWLDRHDINTRGTGKRNHYSDAELLDHLRAVNEAVEYRVTVADVDAAEGPSRSPYRQRFDSFDAALEAAGIDPDAPTQPTAYRDTLETDQGPYLTAHPDVARELTRVSEPVRRRDLDISRSAFHKCRAIGILQHDGAAPTPTPGVDDAFSWTWTLADGVREWIRANVDPVGECPREGCEATGVSNLGDGRYTCSNEGCSSRFGRATAREVLGG